MSHAEGVAHCGRQSSRLAPIYDCEELELLWQDLLDMGEAPGRYQLGTYWDLRNTAEKRSDSLTQMATDS